jgi:hypothetical protein
VRVTVPRRVRSGSRLPVRIACPRGCLAEVQLDLDLPGDANLGSGGSEVVRPGRAVTARLDLRFAGFPERRLLERRGARATLTVTVPGRAAGRGTTIRRRILVLPRRS